MKVSLVITVLNEEKTIGKLLDSLARQTKKPDEIIIVDGGSADNTVVLMKNTKVKSIVKKGNRSIGRNEGIHVASGDIILSTDAGCVLDKDWVKNIAVPFRDAKVDVVAGYYQGLPQNVFQKCLVPYVLVMPDKVNPKTFLPASRSMAFRKSIWEKAGGFPEEFSYNEDYVFAKKLVTVKAHIVFVKDAIVYWIPRKNLKEAFVMFFRFAKGDIEAGIVRPKVVALFLRYFIVLGLVLLSIYYYPTRYLLAILFVIYTVWAVVKNYHYVEDIRAVFILPFFQFTADIAVLLGSVSGIMRGRNGLYERGY